MTSPYLPPGRSGPAADEPPTQPLFTYRVQQPGPPFHADRPGTLPFPQVMPQADPLHTGPPPAAFPAPRPARRRGRTALLVAAVIAVLFLVVGTTAVVTYALTRPAPDESTAAGVTVLAAAKKSCDPSGAGTTLGDGDRTLLLDGIGDEDSSGIWSSGLTCVLNSLHAPMYVQQQLDSTRALDGRQQASWDNLRASWTYHPDAGLDAIITLGSD